MSETKRPLFDKPMDELREAFVRARFAQEDVFGLAEIETWLADQRAQERPDETMWPKFLARDFLAMCAATSPLTHLHERATQHYIQGVESGPYWPIFFQLRGGLYLGHRGVGVYVIGGTNDMFTLDSDAKGRLILERIGDSNPHVGAKAVMDVLFAEWNHQRPKWDKARTFLCDALAQEIAKERAAAERDFDVAVAVSADGTKICTADWVFVLGAKDDASEDVRYPGTAFHAQKVFSIPAQVTNSTPRSMEQLIADAACDRDGLYAIAATFVRPRHDCMQKFVRCSDGKILFVHRDQCPDPLPKGGTPVIPR